MDAVSLKTNRMKSPVGIDPGKVSFSWIPEGGKYQTGFRIEAFCCGEKLLDTGKMISGKTCFRSEYGMPSRSLVEWTVTLWDEEDREGETAVSFFETGPGAGDISALWIEPELEKRSAYVTAKDPLYRASYLRKTFISVKPETARLYITAHGVYDAYVNGCHVDGYFMGPGAGQYDKRIQIQTYDVTELIREGENEILVSLGEGWYRGSLGWPMKRNTFGTQLGLLCQIEVNGETCAVTDGSWQASQNGPLGFNDMMRLESYDANRQIEDWHEVRVIGQDPGNIVGSGLPIAAHERFPARLITTPNGEKVLDFGQNFAGYVEFDLEAAGGETIRMQCGEVLNEHGNFQVSHNMNPEMPYADQKLEYICKPGRNHHHQLKCYYGFQYVKIETDLEITGEEFTGVAVYSDMEQTSFFECGNRKVNKLFENCMWSMKSNFVDIPTDCPTREKSGFGGDIQVFSETALYLMDSVPVLERWLRELAATQFENGCVKEIAPETGYEAVDGCAGWCDAFEIIPWRIMHHLNDTGIAEELYPKIAKWIKFCLGRARNCWRQENRNLPPEIQMYLHDSSWHWGEWKEPGTESEDYYEEGIRTGHAELATAYLAYGCAITAELAEKLGETEDAAYFRDASEKARAAYRYVFTENGRINSGRQCRYVRPIYMDLLDEKEKKQAADSLASLISKQGRIGTGLLTTQELCKVLCDYGHKDTAYGLLLSEKWPSWLYEVDMGANTVWEDWRGNRDHHPFYSQNHYMYATIAGWLIMYSAGIRVSDGVITIRPYPDKRLGFVKGVFDSHMGRIESSWIYEDGSIRYDITVPANCRAIIKLEGLPEQEAGPGSHTFVVRTVGQNN
ncbi:MAG: family 78 glycoside hydrolase catalytic domain [Clostridia bacterium]|nr:family 78 glycoside hydrolase catalytic domain [Clostridia bacterium]